MNQIEQRKFELGLVNFGITVIQNQIKFTKEEASSTYLNDRLSYFTKLSCKIKSGEIAYVSQQELTLLYNLVSNYYSTYSRLFGDSDHTEQHFYIASVAQLKDDLWEAKSHA